MNRDEVLRSTARSFLTGISLGSSKSSGAGTPLRGEPVSVPEAALAVVPITPERETSATLHHHGWQTAYLSICKFRMWYIGTMKSLDYPTSDAKLQIGSPTFPMSVGRSTTYGKSVCSQSSVFGELLGAEKSSGLLDLIMNSRVVLRSSNLVRVLFGNFT